MFPERAKDMVGIYERPSSTESTVMDEIVYTNDFREACSFIIDLIAELYTQMRPILPLYRDQYGTKPPVLISDLINPHRNHENPERNGCARLRYHAIITARYVDGHVPTEDGAKLIRAVNAFFNTVKGLHDSAALRHVEDAFGAYVQIWNRLGRPKLNPNSYANVLHDACEKLIDSLENLSDDLRVYESSRWSGQMTLDFVSADSRVFHNKLDELGKRVVKEAQAVKRTIADSTIEDLKITGPRTPDCCNQVRAVVQFLANPKNPRSLDNACKKAFFKAKDGYKTDKVLYNWCTRNQSKISAWVQEWRMRAGV